MRDKKTPTGRLPDRSTKSMMKRLLHLAPSLLGVVLFAVCLFVLRRELHKYHYHEIVRDLGAIPLGALGLALLCSTLNYATLCVYEILAFRYIGNPLEKLRIALASFVAFAFANNVGFYAVSGSAVRYRFYSAWGLSPGQITRVIAFSSVLTFWVGLCTVAAVAFLIEPVAIPAAFHLPFASVRFVGVIFAAILIAFVVTSAIRRKPVRVGEWEFEIPRLSLSLSLIGTACVDWTLASSVLYVLLPQHPGLGFPAFLSVFLLAQIAGIVSHVPGGLGIFETAILLLLPGLPPTSVIGSLVAFRVVYYLIPLIASALLLALHEGLQKREQIKGAVTVFTRWGTGVVPYVFGALLFVGGLVLLFSGATPGEHVRMEWLQRILPLPVLEASHLMGSVAGIGLLILAWGVFRRLDAAYHLSLYVLAGGVIFSLLKGLDYEEAVILATMLAALLPCRKHFYRKSSVFHEPFTVGWSVALILAVASSVWLGFFSYKHVSYSQELWWHFSLAGHASRFLRASVAVVTFGFGFSLLRLFAPARAQPKSTVGATSARALDVVRGFPKTYAHLALLGDKHILPSGSGKGFIMYGIEGRSWVAMGDPVAPEHEVPELIWDFKTLCDRNGGRSAFYEVGTDNLRYYIDVGLTILKLGEEARVHLAEFSLDGGGKKSLRHTCRRLEQGGLVFEVIPTDQVASHLDSLKSVSDAWLEQKHSREKGFSLGSFDPAYLQQTPCAVVRQGDQVLAFANLWVSGRSEEVSVDLMRYLPSSSGGMMDFLFCNLLLWGKSQGFAWFSLGVAPLSGLEDRALAPLWNRFGAFLFEHGETLYNFHGLRQYKEKFDPVWEPRYLCSPGGLALPVIVKDIASLVSGGVTGVFAK